jgi:hypothetical protein
MTNIVFNTKLTSFFVSRPIVTISHILIPKYRRYYECHCNLWTCQNFKYFSDLIYNQLFTFRLWVCLFQLKKMDFFFIFFKIDFVKPFFKILQVFYTLFAFSKLIYTLILTLYNINIYYWGSKHTQNRNFFKKLYFNNDFYENLFEIVSKLSDFFEILISKNNFNKMMKYLK